MLRRIWAWPDGRRDGPTPPCGWPLQLRSWWWGAWGHPQRRPSPPPRHWWRCCSWWTPDAGSRPKSLRRHAAVPLPAQAQVWEPARSLRSARRARPLAWPQPEAELLAPTCTVAAERLPRRRGRNGVALSSLRGLRHPPPSAPVPSSAASEHGAWPGPAA
jgi:hypothetical protein